MATALAHLLLAYLILIAPWLSRLKYRQLQLRLASGQVGARIRFYQMTCIQQLARILIVLALSFIGAIPPRAMGLAPPVSWYDTGRVLTLLALVLAASIVLFHLVGDWQLRRLLKMVGALIPISAAERRWFALVGLGAGVSEEIVFRGFLFFYLATFTSFSSTQIIVASSLLFGFCHIYQGWFGVLGTALAGFCLAFLYAGTGSLLVPIIVHAALDLRLLLILTPKRIAKVQPAPPGPT